VLEQSVACVVLTLNDLLIESICILWVLMALSHSKWSFSMPCELYRQPVKTPITV
jgi:hypothetical protein